MTITALIELWEISLNTDHLEKKDISKAMKNKLAFVQFCVHDTLQHPTTSGVFAEIPSLTSQSTNSTFYLSYLSTQVPLT